MGACCIWACYRFLGTYSGVDLAGDWCLFQARIFALLMMFNVLCLLLNSRSLLEYILYYIFFVGELDSCASEPFRPRSHDHTTPAWNL